MTVTHIVQLAFKSDISAQVVKETCNRMLALKGKCISPTTGKPYIVSSRGGKENSVEGLQSGITHVFVVEFASAADRDYYALKDPIHLEFGAFIRTVAAKAIVVDFSSDAF